MKQLISFNSIIMCAATWVAGALLSVSYAQTPSGTQVDNTFQGRVIALIDGTVQNGDVDSSTATFIVDELIEVDVTRTSPELIETIAGEQNVVHSFRVENFSNGRESYQFRPESVGDVALENIRVYFDDGVPGFQGTEVLYVPGTPFELARDGQDGDFVELLVVSDVPQDPGNVTDAVIRLAAVSDTAIQAGVEGARIGFGINGDGSNETNNGEMDGSADGVLGFTQGDDFDDGDILVVNVVVVAVKSSVVTDGQGGDSVNSGSRITYTIQISAQGDGPAREVAFRDAIPEFTTYEPGSLRLDGQSLTDVSGDDAGDFNVSNLNSVTVQLGDLTAADPALQVSFTVVVN